MQKAFLGMKSKEISDIFRLKLNSLSSSIKEAEFQETFQLGHTIRSERRFKRVYNKH